jgi:pilus assembly protein CpaF
VICQARCADGSRRIVAVSEVVRVAAGPAARELYTWRDGTSHWASALGDELAARLEAAG